jgi:hypothetical protein
VRDRPVKDRKISDRSDDNRATRGAPCAPQGYSKGGARRGLFVRQAPLPMTRPTRPSGSGVSLLGISKWAVDSDRSASCAARCCRRYRRHESGTSSGVRFRTDDVFRAPIVSSHVWRLSLEHAFPRMSLWSRPALGMASRSGPFRGDATPVGLEAKIARR